QLFRSFPTRRSSDLGVARRVSLTHRSAGTSWALPTIPLANESSRAYTPSTSLPNPLMRVSEFLHPQDHDRLVRRSRGEGVRRSRSEEHTSELQSLAY